MFKFTPTIATSAFLFMSGTADLFAMEPSNDDHDKTLATINHMPRDVMGLILTEMSKDVNPRHLVSVCKNWYRVMRESDIPEVKAELHYVATNLLELSMNPFMQKCMNTYWENQFYNGILRYTPLDNNGRVTKDEGGAAITLKFSDFKDGTFDLSTCGITNQYLVITTSMDHFFQVRKENEGKTVIGIMPRHRIQQEIKNTPNHPFGPLMAGWDADKAPVGMFWRCGGDRNLTWVDYLTSETMSKISSRNFHDHWHAVLQGGGAAVSGMVTGSTLGVERSISCQFLNQNKDY